MTSVEAARLVVKSKTCHMVRRRKGPSVQYDARPYHLGGKKKGWFYLDLFSASAVTAVYDALNEENRQRFAGLPLVTAVKVAFQLIQRNREA